MKQILFATTNPGKLAMVQEIYAHHDMKVVGPQDLGLQLEVDETGSSLEENARLKAVAYQKVLPADMIVITDDTGIEIDALGGKPGIKVRRWKGYPMTDEEIITYCLEQMRNIPKDKRGAQFRTVLAVVQDDKPIRYFDGILRGEILGKPEKMRREGMPFWPLFYIPKLGMTLGEFHAAPIEFQLAHPTHREKAVIATLPYLATLIH